MNRRAFFKASLAAAAGSTLPMPAIASSEPEVRWRLTSIVPPSMDAIWAGSENLASRVHEATDGRFQIQTFGAGEIVGPMDSFDAIQDGTVEMGHTALHYFIGKEPSFAVMSSLPFGMNTRQVNAWMFEAGGIDLCNSVLEKHNLFALPGGSPGEQMGGWFRKEINSVADLEGLRFRIPGIAGRIVEKLGVVPQMIPAGDVYSSLQRGVIDAVEFVGPYDDEKLGFVEVAPYYYFPSFWEGSSIVHFVVNLDAWNQLPPSYQAIFKSAAAEANFRFTANYDILSPQPLKRLVAAGAKLRPFTQDVLDAAYKASIELYSELSDTDDDFKMLFDAHKTWLDDLYLYHRFTSHSYDQMMIKLLST